MAQSPRYKIYDAAGEYQASVKDLTLAGGLMAILGEGATVRDGHRLVIYTEGIDGDSGNSYDDVAAHVLK